MFGGPCVAGTVETCGIRVFANEFHLSLKFRRVASLPTAPRKSINLLESFLQGSEISPTKLDIYESLSLMCGGIRSLGVGWSGCAGVHPERPKETLVGFLMLAIIPNAQESAGYRETTRGTSSYIISLMTGNLRHVPSYDA